MRQRAPLSLIMLSAMLGLELGCNADPKGGGRSPAESTPENKPLTLVSAGREGASKPPLGIDSNDLTYYLSFKTDPDPIPLNTPFEIAVAVFGGKDRSPVEEKIELEIDANMPAHYHGMNRRRC